MPSKQFELTFRSMDVLPEKAGECVLYNQCDGYHQVEARMNEDGSFDGFYDWMGSFPHVVEHFAAWAHLPDCNADLYPVFADPRPYGERA